MTEQNNKATRAKRLNEKILLDSIKNKWLESTGNIEMEYDATVSKTKGKYYFKELEKNLIPKGMGKNAKEDYGEDWRMRALYSSAAMTFNIFGNDTVEVRKNNPLGITAGEYNIKYEKKLPTGVNSAKANIDACLTSKFGGENEIVLFEMKMTEWLLRQPKKLRETYLNAGNEYSELIKLAKKFVDTEKICRQDGKVFHPATTYYFDVVQVILHLWGLYNTVIVNKTEFIGVKNITLICGMWTIENKEFRQFERYEKIKKDADIEFQRFKDSKELEDVIKIFDKENICLKIKKMTVKEIIECLGKSNEPYLKRYI